MIWFGLDNMKMPILLPSQIYLGIGFLKMPTKKIFKKFQNSTTKNPWGR